MLPVLETKMLLAQRAMQLLVQGATMLLVQRLECYSYLEVYAAEHRVVRGVFILVPPNATSVPRQRIACHKHAMSEACNTRKPEPSSVQGSA